ncbi:MAG: EamA family transporter [Candidatus Eremiobacteraeota bacterium]|nr:EamA family transporter [Candidatus Eremiobacteraeota bacterium]
MVVALSLVAALVYGAADFFGGLATRRHAALVVVVWSQVAGVAVLLAALAVVPGVPHASDFGWGAACGAAAAFAVALLYRGLAVGVMGVVSPITAVLAATIPVVFAIARGERPALLALAGIVLALVAVVMVSAATHEPTAAEQDAPLARPRRLPPGIPEALGAGIAFGVFLIALAQTHADGGLYPLLTTRATSLAIMVAGALVLRRSLRAARPGRGMIVACGVLDMGANVFFVLAVHTGALAIVAVITALYPAATVALAALLLRERLAPVQWAGVALAFAGVLCISLAR